MSDKSTSGKGGPVRAARALLGKIFPAAPDFFTLLHQHALVIEEAGAALQSRVADSTECPDLGEVVKRGHSVQRHNLDELDRAFVTPIDREDIFRATSGLGEVLDYLESTEREMSLLAVPPDENIRKMLDVLGHGIEALTAGFAALGTELEDVEAQATRAIDSERTIEGIYRAALADLFSAEVEVPEALTAAECYRRVVMIFKTREVYRHISNAADRVALVGRTLHDIVVKWA